MRSEKPANGSHFPTAFEAFKGAPFNTRLSCVNPLRQRRTRWHSPESEDIWLFGEGKLVLLGVWRQLLDELRGQVTQPAVWDPEFVFTTAAKQANKFTGVFRLATSQLNVLFFFFGHWVQAARHFDFSLFAVSESHEINMQLRDVPSVLSIHDTQDWWRYKSYVIISSLCRCCSCFNQPLSFNSC